MIPITPAFGYLPTMQRDRLPVLIALGVIAAGLIQAGFGIMWGDLFYATVGAGESIIGVAYLWSKRSAGQ